MGRAVRCQLHRLFRFSSYTCHQGMTCLLPPSPTQIFTSKLETTKRSTKAGVPLWDQPHLKVRGRGMQRRGVEVSLHAAFGEHYAAAVGPVSPQGAWQGSTEKQVRGLSSKIGVASAKSESLQNEDSKMSTCGGNMVLCSFL